jgi:hypothetical protein
MQKQFRSCQFILLLGMLMFNATTSQAQDTDLIRHFDYDDQASLGIKEPGLERRGEVAIHDITYVSPKGGIVPAYLVVPKGKGPFAAVIWGHWYWSNSPMRNRKEFLDEAVALAQAGVVSLLTDGPIAFSKQGAVERAGRLRARATGNGHASRSGPVAGAQGC